MCSATVAQWAWLRVDAWQTERSTIAVAAAAVGGDYADSATAAGALSRRFADERHRAGLVAPADALPLLARAAPPLAALPPRAIRSATFASGSWTFDLAKIDAAALAEFEQGLTMSGLVTLRATTPTGARVRVALAPGMDRP